MANVIPNDEHMQIHQEVELSALSDKRKRQLQFILKLHEILDNSDYSHLISWLPHGRAFIIRNFEGFKLQVLPTCFKLKTFCFFGNFVLSFNFKLEMLENQGGAIFSHENFIRYRPQLCLSIQRVHRPSVRIVYRPSPTQQTSQEANKKVDPKNDTPQIASSSTATPPTINGNMSQNVACGGYAPCVPGNATPGSISQSVPCGAGYSPCVLGSAIPVFYYPPVCSYFVPYPFYVAVSPVSHFPMFSCPPPPMTMAVGSPSVTMAVSSPPLSTPPIQQPAVEAKAISIEESRPSAAFEEDSSGDNDSVNVVVDGEVYRPST